MLFLVSFNTRDEPKKYKVILNIGFYFLLNGLVCSFPGNVFVLAAIWMERNLHSVANYLIVSLAVADLMVACLVMPLGAVYEVGKSESYTIQCT